MKSSAIPEYLKHYMARQNYNAYTPIDHAIWRYIMRISQAFFKDHAHQKYLTGLKETGITTDRIPRMTEMDQKLKKFGWRVATVTGFIPPSVFLEFLSLNILPIACDMRRLEHLEYTPAPDIVHEAAGHAPIISAPQYAAYLNRFGEIARKAIFAKEDLEVYEAIKELSEIKESADSTVNEITAAEKKLEETLKTVTYTSEATKLARLGWWSIEYGLIRSGRNSSDFKIYGAGLLSSVGESYDCFSKNVKKVPLTIDCVDVSYDITKPQPQLFYVENFKQLENVIDELSWRLAYRLGGLEGLARAKRSALVNTVELDSGLQISGRLTGVYTANIRAAKAVRGLDEMGEPWREGVNVAFAEFQGTPDEKLNSEIEKKYGQPAYLQFTGPVQLSLNDKQLPGHSAKYHAPGYGTPLGRIKGLQKAAAQLTKRDLAKLGFRGRARGRLEYESGVVVEGVLKRVLRMRGCNLVLTFSDCRVYHPGSRPGDNERVFFQPDWGTFDLACGEKVESVFGGPADRKHYLSDTRSERPKIRGQNSTVTRENRELIPLYARARKLRKRAMQLPNDSRLRSPAAVVENEIKEIIAKLRAQFQNDWLLRLELIEILHLVAAQIPESLPKWEKVRFQNLREQIENDLSAIAARQASVETLIRRGLNLLGR